MKIKLKTILIILIAFIFTTYFTFPLILRLSTNFINNTDYYLNSWTLWYTSHSILDGTFFNPKIFFNSPQLYPFPSTLAQQDFFALPCLAIYTPALLISKNPILSVNIFIFTSFLLNFLSSYFFLWKMMKNSKGAIIGATIFTFSSVVIWVGTGYFEYTNRFLIPPLFYLLFCFIKKPDLKTSLKLFAIYTLLWFCSIQMAVFATLTLILIFISYFALSLFINKDNLKSLLKFPKYIAIGLIFLPIIFHFFSPYIEYSNKEKFERSLSESQLFSPKLLEFFIPTSSNLVYRGVRSILNTHSIHINAIEKLNSNNRSLLFPGLTAYISLIFFTIEIIKNKENKNYLNMFTIATFITLILLIILSFGPYLQIGNNTIKLPYFYVYEIFPLLKATRTPLRLSYVWLFLISIIASYEYIVISSKKRVNKKLLFIAVIFFMLIEYKIEYPIQSQSYIPLNFNLSGQKVLFLPIREEHELDDAKYLAQHFTNNFVSVNGDTGSQFAMKYYGGNISSLNSNMFTEHWFLILKLLDIKYVAVDKIAAAKQQYSDQKIIANLPKYSKYIVYEDSNWAVLDLSKYTTKWMIPCENKTNSDLDYKFDVSYNSKNNNFDIGYTVENVFDCDFRAFYNSRYIRVDYTTGNTDKNGYFYIIMPPYLFKHSGFDGKASIINRLDQISKAVTLTIDSKKTVTIQVKD